MFKIPFNAFGLAHSRVSRHIKEHFLKKSSVSMFDIEVAKIPVEKRCLQTQTGEWNLPLGNCYFGVPESEFFGWTPLDKVPDESKEFYFYLGSDCNDLIEGFVTSHHPAKVEKLTIGDSSFLLGSGRDYTEISKLLSATEFPKLKVLQLGVWELFSNSHCILGNLGNITDLLQKMPKLESLALYGSFQLDQAISLPELLDLTVTLDDSVTCINGGFISQASLNNLLESKFPKLKTAFIDLECDGDDQNYTLSSKYNLAEKMPNLETIEFTGGYEDGEIEKFRQNALAQKPQLNIYYEQSYVAGDTTGDVVGDSDI